MRIANIDFPRPFVIHLHWPWLVSLALLCLVVEMMAVELPAMQTKREAIRTHEINLKEQLTQVSQVSALQQSDHLSSQLPTFERLSIVTHDLHTLAQENGLILSDATYTTVGGPETFDIRKIDIDVRLKGTYLPLNKMLGTLLASHDGLSLESISIRRTRAIDTVSEIEVQLALYFRTQA